MTNVQEAVNAMASRQLSITRLINAPRKLLWEVWTNPEHIKNWWGPDGFRTTIHQMDVTANGVWDFIMHGPDGTDYPNKDVFVEIIKPEKIVYDHVNYPLHRTTITFEDKGNKTLLTMTMVFESEALKEQIIKTHKADVGLKQNITRLEEYLKKFPSIT